MALTSFNELIHLLKDSAKKRRMAVAVAGEAHTLEAAVKAANNGLVEPLFVGDKRKIEEALQEIKEMGYTLDPHWQVYDVADPVLASERAVALVRCGQADFIMKGNVDTKVILKAVVNKEKGLGLGKLMSHFTIFEVPTYHKLLVIVDGGMVTYPTLEEKAEIIHNSVRILHKLGYKNPKVGVLACVEKINPKMPETVEADALKQMNENFTLTGCVVEGPISYDLAISKEAARLKGYESPVAGDVDILVVPNIHVGNALGKMLMWTARSRMAGFVVGAACPVVLTSRASSADEKYMSIVLSAAVSGGTMYGL